MKSPKRTRSGSKRRNILLVMVKHGYIKEGSEVLSTFKRIDYKGTIRRTGIEAAHDREVYPCPTAFVRAIWKEAGHLKRDSRPTGWKKVKIVKDGKHVPLKELKDKYLSDDLLHGDQHTTDSTSQETLVPPSECETGSEDFDAHENSDHTVDSEKLRTYPTAEDEAPAMEELDMNPGAGDDAPAMEDHDIEGQMTTDQKIEKVQRLLLDKLQRMEAAIDEARIENQNAREETREELLSYYRQLQETREDFLQAQDTLTWAVGGHPFQPLHHDISGI